MATKEQVLLYIRYYGDGDAFVQFALTEEKSIMNYSTWMLIDSIAQDITIINTQKASKNFIKEFESRLIENFDNIETYKLLSHFILES